MHASASTLDVGERRRLRFERPERRVALHVPLHVPRLEELSGGERRAADDALDVRGEHLLVADAVLHGRDGAVRERVRRRADRGLGVHRLRRDDAEVARGQLLCVGRRAQAPDDVTCARQTEAVRVDRVDVVARGVERPHLDVLELRQIRGEQRADGATTDDADPHE